MLLQLYLSTVRPFLTRLCPASALISGVDVNELSDRLQQIAERSSISTTGSDEVLEDLEQIQYEDQQKTPSDAVGGDKEELETPDPAQTKREPQTKEEERSNDAVVNNTPLTPPVSLATAVHSDGGSAGSSSGPKPQVEKCASPLSPAPMLAAPDVGGGNGKGPAVVEGMTEEDGPEEVAAKRCEGEAEQKSTVQETVSAGER